jgi:hypothetical protein
MPMPPPPPPVRQHTCPEPQLAWLEQDVVCAVPAGHAAAFCAQLKVAAIPIPPALAQQVRLGATQ